jgi:hypothetical protein
MLLAISAFLGFSSNPSAVFPEEDSPSFFNRRSFLLHLFPLRIPPLVRH